MALRIELCVPSRAHSCSTRGSRFVGRVLSPVQLSVKSEWAETQTCDLAGTKFSLFSAHNGTVVRRISPHHESPRAPSDVATSGVKVRLTGF